MNRSSWYLLGAVVLFAAALAVVVTDLPPGGPVPAGPPGAPSGPVCPGPVASGSPPESIEVTYALGWDDGVVQPLSEREAQARDTAGEPYVAVLHDGPRPVALVRTAWADRRLEVLRLDDAGRTVAHLDLRDAQDGTVFLREHQSWDHAGGPEHRAVTYFRDGRCRDVDETPDGGSLHRIDRVERPSLARPERGDWGELLALAGLGTASAPVELTEAHGDVLPRSDGDPWAPPGPLAPGDVAAMFEPGTQVRTTFGTARIEVRDAGHVRIPSGRVVAMDPGYLPEVGEPLVVEVPPGSYPVTVAAAADDAGETVVAARLTVRDTTVKTWELGLRAGEDLIELGDGELYGFGVDSGTAAFTDADVADDVTDAAYDAMASLGRGHAEVGDHELVMWSSGYGDGYYPVWVGRDGRGRVAALVADMLVLEGPDQFTAGP